MKKSTVALLAVTGACLCVMLGIFIGRNLLPNYYMRPAPSANTDSDSTHSDMAGRININTASIEQLKQLPDIGQTTAERILAYREEHGEFSTIEDLLNVKGIGYGTLYNIKDYITTGG